MDIAGEIDAVGEGVERFLLGRQLLEACASVALRSTRSLAVFKKSRII